ncbi:phospholipase A and acyltransferase 4-like [Cynocephalus volans]|uniref:phospholipase A and acyltransferase 4-like n=1 Tax=Cynocephalus volans TaxID=110931 RepID=UPI002FCC0992
MNKTGGRRLPEWSYKQASRHLKMQELTTATAAAIPQVVIVTVLVVAAVCILRRCGKRSRSHSGDHEQNRWSSSTRVVIQTSQSPPENAGTHHRRSCRCTIQSSRQQPKPGDLIEIFHNGYEHWAIYVGDGYVVHLAPLSKCPKAGSTSFSSIPSDRAVVKQERLEDVVGGCRYRVNNDLDHNYKPLPVSEIIKSAKEKVGQEVEYSFVTKNCEHFVTDLRYGKERCRQVERVAIGGLATTVFGILGAIGLAAVSRIQQSQ